MSPSPALPEALEVVPVRVELPDPQELRLRFFLSGIQEVATWAGRRGGAARPPWMRAQAYQRLNELYFFDQEYNEWLSYQNGCGDSARLSQPLLDGSRLLVIFNHESARSPWGRAGGLPPGEVLFWLSMSERDAVIGSDERVRSSQPERPLSVTSVYRWLPDGRVVSGRRSVERDDMSENLPLPWEVEPEEGVYFALYRALQAGREATDPSILGLLEECLASASAQDRVALAHQAFSIGVRAGLIPG